MFRGGLNELLGACRFNNNSCAVAKNLSESRHEFGCVISHGDDAAGTEKASVSHHVTISLFSSLLAKLSVDRDVAAKKCLYAA